jgi:hypothetical protein
VFVNPRYEESLMFKGATLLPWDSAGPWDIAIKLGGDDTAAVALA